MRKKNINGTLVKVPPQRTCISCHQVGDKRELVRIVRLPDGSVQVDLTGRKSGRGAYVCSRRECLESGLSQGRLEHSLKAKITEENREQLIANLQGLKKEKSIG